MKLWKGATFAFMLCGGALSILLTRNMVTIGPLRLKQRIKAHQSSPSTSSSSSSSSSSPLKPPSLAMTREISLSSSSSQSPQSSSSSSRAMGGLHRKVRTADDISSLLSEFSHLLQSFSDGELKQVIGTLMDRNIQKERLEESQEGQESQTKRTKRAKRRLKPCALRELQVTVSELGLGYVSDETLVFRYCSGKCAARRRNYDLALEHLRRTGVIRKGRKKKVRYSPCCRPITYEKDISFLDNNARYHTLQEVSARQCGCA